MESRDRNPYARKFTRSVVLLIPGFVIGLLTFPGVVIHEFAHKRCCDCRGVLTGDVVYFRLGNPAGYVEHARPDRFRDAFLIAVAPFAVNSVLAVVLFAGLMVLFPSETGMFESTTGAYVLLWLGVSVGMHAFPSNQDAKNLWTRALREWRELPAVILSLPVVGLIYLANLLSFVWFDLIYALGLYVLVVLVLG